MNKNIASVLVLVFLTASCIIVTLPVKAGFKTIVVPDDYSTIAVAIGNATDGDTLFIKKGTYEEKTLEISKTLSLIGEDTDTTVIKLHPPVYNVTHILTQYYAALSNAITINANDFRLSNLTISLSPDGYIAASGDRTQIMGNNIIGGSATGLLISGSYCNITDNTSGGFISLSGSSNMIARNSVSRICVSGDSNKIGNNTFWELELSDASQNAIYGNKIGITTRDDYGVYMVRNSSNNFFYANEISAYMNDVEINGTSWNNKFYHNNFLNNLYGGAGITTSNCVNFWDNGKEGNYWGDYNGTDANRNGIGDIPYVIDASNVDNYPLMFPYDSENDSVVLPPPEPFSITLVVAAVATAVAIVGVGLLIYFKKHKH